jgi:hypothetical protein
LPPKKWAAHLRETHRHALRQLAQPADRQPGRHVGQVDQHGHLAQGAGHHHRPADIAAGDKTDIRLKAVDDLLAFAHAFAHLSQTRHNFHRIHGAQLAGADAGVVQPGALHQTLLHAARAAHPEHRDWLLTCRARRGGRGHRRRCCAGCWRGGSCRRELLDYGQCGVDVSPRSAARYQHVHSHISPVQPDAIDAAIAADIQQNADGSHDTTSELPP